MWSVADPGLWFEGGLSQAAKGKKQQELSLQVSIWESFGRGSSHLALLNPPLYVIIHLSLCPSFVACHGNGSHFRVD